MLAAIQSCWPFPYEGRVAAPPSRTSPFDAVFNLPDLTRRLTARDCNLDQWLQWKKEIKSLILKYGNDIDQVDTFLKTITAWGLQRDPQKATAFFLDIISLDLLEQVIRSKKIEADVPFKSVLEWAAEHELLCPPAQDHSLTTSVYSEWRKYRHIVLHFIPNLINIFLGAFNFLDARRKFTTLFEQHLLLEIICKFLLIPICLIKALQPVFVVTAKVYLVAAGIIVTTGILISCYQRWLRPLSDEIVNCSNLNKKMEQGLLEPKVGQVQEMERLIAALEVESNVLLIANSGDGKTALMHHFIQRQHNKELPENLQNLQVHEVDCGLIVSSYNYGHSEVINQIKGQTEGHDGQVLLFFDEFYQITTNRAAFQAFKKRFLEDKPHSKFIAAITFKEFEEIKKLDVDGSFRRRVVPIMIQPASDEQTRLILQELINRVAKDIPVTDEAIDEILEILASDDLSDIGRPAKAINILMEAIGFCRIAYNPHYVSPELSEARQKYESLRLQAVHQVKVNAETLKQIREIRNEIADLERDLKKNKQHVLNIKKIKLEQHKLHADYYHLTRLLSQAHHAASAPLQRANGAARVPNKTISPDAQAMYLWYYFYAIEALKTIVQEEIDQVRAEIPIQVDAELIRSVYEQSQLGRKKLFDDMQKKEEEEEEVVAEIVDNAVAVERQDPPAAKNE